MGLAISRKILQAYGSDIFVESKLGQGSTFSFNLVFPLGPKQVVKEVAETLPSLSGMKVLVVEDNQINVKVATRSLTKWDVSYDIAFNGNEALVCTKETQYDLILMDLLMPIKDGYEATRQIRGF